MTALAKPVRKPDRGNRAKPARKPDRTYGFRLLWRLIARDRLLAIWALYVVTFPIYLFPSGLPQPADVFILILAPSLLSSWNGRLAKPERRALLALFAFTAYTVVSALAWSVALDTAAINLKLGFLLSPVFYLYNGLVFLIALLLHRRSGDRFIAVTVRAAVLSVLLQIPMSFVFGHKSLLRSSGMFNNPNQFGYFAVMSAAIIILGQRRAKLPSLHVAIGIVASGYLALASASKAALAATGLILAVSSLMRLRTVLLAAAVATAAIVVIDPSSDLVDASVQRFSAEHRLDFAEERGYDRIAEYPEDWAFGAGEGGYYRYVDTSKIGEHELHSSAGTLFFCYGIVGSLVFLWFTFQLIRIGSISQIMLLGAVAAYGLSHQGLRVSLFWIFLALFVIAGSRRPPARAPARSSRPAPAE